jgi:hypothetical protein
MITSGNRLAVVEALYVSDDLSQDTTEPQASQEEC